MDNYSKSSLALAEKSFAQVSHIDPTPLVTTATQLGWTHQPETVSELRTLLLNGGADRSVKDAIWSTLIQLARTEPDPWSKVATGMMMPGLRRIASRWCRCYPKEAYDLDSEILVAFWQALRTIDPGTNSLPRKLCDAANYGARIYVNALQRRCPPVAELEGIVWTTPSGSPETVLEDAFRNGSVTNCQFTLMDKIYLGSWNSTAAARRFGMSRRQVRRELAIGRRGLSAYLVTV